MVVMRCTYVISETDFVSIVRLNGCDYNVYMRSDLLCNPFVDICID